uniref:Uncharacterized protein n=1 Tax=Helianthus annuus TaxID=4232 RepID=A0A251TGK8_HELAN
MRMVSMIWEFSSSSLYGLGFQFSIFLSFIVSKLTVHRFRQERIGRGWKRWEDIGPCLRGEEDAQRFEDIF